MHFRFPQMSKIVPYICFSFKKAKDDIHIFTGDKNVLLSQIKKINAHDGRSCWSKYKLVWPLVHVCHPLSRIHTGISASTLLSQAHILNYPANCEILVHASPTSPEKMRLAAQILAGSLVQFCPLKVSHDGRKS